MKENNPFQAMPKADSLSQLKGGLKKKADQNQLLTLTSSSNPSVFTDAGIVPLHQKQDIFNIQTNSYDKQTNLFRLPLGTAGQSRTITPLKLDTRNVTLTTIGQSTVNLPQNQNFKKKDGLKNQKKEIKVFFKTTFGFTLSDNQKIKFQDTFSIQLNNTSQKIDWKYGDCYKQLENRPEWNKISELIAERVVCLRVFNEAIKYFDTKITNKAIFRKIQTHNNISLQENTMKRLAIGFDFYNRSKLQQNSSFKKSIQVYQTLIKGKNYQNLILSLMKKLQISIICAYYLVNAYCQNYFSNMDIEAFANQSSSRINDDSRFLQQILVIIFDQMHFLLKIYQFYLTRKLTQLITSQSQYLVLNSFFQINPKFFQYYSESNKQVRQMQINQQIANIVIFFYQLKFKTANKSNLQVVLDKAIKFLKGDKLKNRLFQLRIILNQKGQDSQNIGEIENISSQNTNPNNSNIIQDLNNVSQKYYGSFAFLIKYLNNQRISLKVTLQEIAKIQALEMSVWLKKMQKYLKDPQSRGVFALNRKQDPDQNLETDLMHFLIIFKCLQKLKYTKNKSVQHLDQVKHTIQSSVSHQSIISSLLNNYLRTIIKSKTNHCLFFLRVIMYFNQKNIKSYAVNQEIFCQLMKKIKNLPIKSIKQSQRIYKKLNDVQIIRQNIKQYFLSYISFPQNQCLIPQLVFQNLIFIIKNVKSYKIKDLNKQLMKDYFYDKQYFFDYAIDQQSSDVPSAALQIQSEQMQQIKRTFKFYCQMFDKMQKLTEKSFIKIVNPQEFIKFLNKSLSILNSKLSYSGKSGNTSNLKSFKQKILQSLLQLYHKHSLKYLQKYKGNELSKNELTNIKQRCLLAVKIINFYYSLLHQFCEGKAMNQRKLELFKQFWNKYQKYIILNGEQTQKFYIPEIKLVLGNFLDLINKCQLNLQQLDIKQNVDKVTSIITFFKNQMLCQINGNLQDSRQDSNSLKLIELFRVFMQNLSCCEKVVKLSPHDTIKLFQLQVVQIILKGLSSTQVDDFPTSEFNVWHYLFKLYKSKQFNNCLKAYITQKLISQGCLNNLQHIQAQQNKIIQILWSFQKQFLSEILSYDKKNRVINYQIWMQSLLFFSGKLKTNLVNILFQNKQTQQTFIQIWRSLVKINQSQDQSENSTSIKLFVKVSLQCVRMSINIIQNLPRKKAEILIRQIGLLYSSVSQRIEKHSLMQDHQETILNILKNLIPQLLRHVFAVQLDNQIEVLRHILKPFFLNFNKFQQKLHIFFLYYVQQLCTIMVSTQLQQGEQNSYKKIGQRDLIMFMQISIQAYRVCKINKLNYCSSLQKLITIVTKMIQLFMEQYDSGQLAQRGTIANEILSYLQQMIAATAELTVSQLTKQKQKQRQSFIQSRQILAKIFNYHSSSDKILIPDSEINYVNLLCIVNSCMIKKHQSGLKFQIQFLNYRSALLGIPKFQFTCAQQFFQKIRMWNIIIRFLIKFKNFLSLNSQFPISTKLIFIQQQRKGKCLFLDARAYVNLIYNLKLVQRLQFYDNSYNSALRAVKNKQISDLPNIYEQIIKCNMSLTAVTSDLFTCLVHSFIYSDQKDSVTGKSMNQNFTQIIQQITIQTFTSRIVEFLQPGDQTGSELNRAKLKNIRNLQKLTFLKYIFQFLNICFERKMLTNYHINTPLNLLRQNIIKFEFNQNQERTLASIILSITSCRSILHNFSSPIQFFEKQLQKKTHLCSFQLEGFKFINNQINYFEFNQLIVKLSFEYNALILCSYLRCTPQSHFVVKQSFQKSQLINTSLQLLYFFYFNFFTKGQSRHQISLQITAYDRIQAYLEEGRRIYASSKYKNNILQFSASSKKIQVQKLLLNALKTMDLYQGNFQRKELLIFNQICRKVEPTSTMSSFQIGSIQKQL